MGNPIEQSDKGQGVLQASDAKTPLRHCQDGYAHVKMLNCSTLFSVPLDECDVKVRVQEPGRIVLVG